MLSIFMTLLSWFISLVVGRAIFTLVVCLVGGLVALLVFMWIIKSIKQTYGTKVSLYVLGISAGVALLFGLIWPWVTAEETVNPTIYVHAKEAIRGNAFTSPLGIFGRRTKTITLIDIGVPALDAQFGQDSKEYLHLLVADKSVAVLNPQTTRTTLEGVVTTPEGWIAQQMMVKAGMAWCTGNSWRKEEKEARRANRGLWAVYGNTYNPDNYKFDDTLIYHEDLNDR